MFNSVVKKIKGLKVIKRNSYYIKHYYKDSLDDRLILLESKNGSDLAGNIFHILKALSNKEYENYKICLIVADGKKEELRQKIENNHLRQVEYVDMMSKRHFKILATAKYIFTDTSLERIYIKKKGQIITNTWHGTPLKYMGRQVENRIYAMGNVQKNLLMSDYLVYPNDFMREKMVDAYGLEGLYQGTILCEGYPRNSVFFDPNAGSHIRKELGLEGKDVFIYMPTWRGLLTNKESDKLLFSISYFMKPLDRMLTDDQVFYIKLHPFVEKGMDFSEYKHIKPYPDQYDVYEFMNMCDCLVTDYSSVFFDFANTRKKVVMFAYDEAEYMKQRGMYLQLGDLPFPIAKTAEQLIQELNKPKDYDDTEFLKRCCTYDGPNAAERICQHVILGKKVCKEMSIYDPKKEKVLLYGSTLAKNGLTTALVNLLHNLDLDKRDYYVTFKESFLRKTPLRVQQIPEGVGMLPISSEPAFTYLEKYAWDQYFKKSKNSKFIQKYITRLFKREVEKHFGSVNFSCVIQYAGYEALMIKMFQAFDTKRVIFVHNDMYEEARKKGNQHWLTIEEAYNEYDKVAVVTQDIMAATKKISAKEENKVVVNNCHAYKEVLEKAKAKLAFDPETTGNVTVEELQEILASDMTKIINIGRFANEKNQIMLIDAFEKFQKKNPNSCLIIIGGYGPLYNKIVSYAEEKVAKIVVLRAMQNPFTVLRDCDLFILASTYEGLGLTILEADTLGIPVISTNIPGPKGFVEEHGGYLVEPTVKGLKDGMQAFMKGEVKTMNVDFEEYNKNAVKQFESLL